MFSEGNDPASILHEFTCQSCGAPLAMNWSSFHFNHTDPLSLCSGGYAITRQQSNQPAIVHGEVIEVTDSIAVGIPTLNVGA